MIFQFTAALVTAYVLGHPELGLFEGEESTRINIANFGPIWGIVITSVQGLVWIISPCAMLAILWHYDRKNEKLTHLSLLIYSAIFAFGTSLLIIRFLDAANDLSWLFFHGSPAWIDLFLGSLLVGLLLLFTVFFFLSLAVYYLMVRKWHSPLLV